MGLYNFKMEELLKDLTIKINQDLFLKDPESSKLGRRILGEGILLIDEIGFEEFTFKKLGNRIGSNESSIYRYFKNKHTFLVYIINWFWGWKEYHLAFATYGIQNSYEKLLKAIEVMAHPVEEDIRFSHINEVALNNIIINEAAKSYLTKEVDEENENGYFILYKRLITRICNMVRDVEEDYEYPFSLASTIADGSLHLHFLNEHFSSITDTKGKCDPSHYLKIMVSNLLQRTDGKEI